jgi:putative transcriptional regulator
MAWNSSKSMRRLFEEAGMEIYINLDMMLVKKKMTLSELADRVGITLANLSILKTNKARAIRFSTLAALCRELECQPGDLLEYRDH